MKQPAIFAGRGNESAETPDGGGPEVQGLPSGNGTVSAPGSPFAKEIKRFRAICSDARHEAHVRQPRRLTFASYRARLVSLPALLLPESITPSYKDIRM